MANWVSEAKKKVEKSKQLVKDATTLLGEHGYNHKGDSVKKPKKPKSNNVNVK